MEAWGKVGGDHATGCRIEGMVQIKRGARFVVTFDSVNTHGIRHGVRFAVRAGDAFISGDKRCAPVL